MISLIKTNIGMLMEVTESVWLIVKQVRILNLRNDRELLMNIVFFSEFEHTHLHVWHIVVTIFGWRPSCDHIFSQCGKHTMHTFLREM